MLRSSPTASAPQAWKCLAVLLCLVVSAWPSFAVLGGDVSSIQADQIRINASVRVTRAEKYTIHELRSTSGAVVREYASPSGKVFAVAWHTPGLPNMKELLGAHFEEFQQAAQGQNRHGVHAPLFIQLSDLVVEMGGHMRSFVGRAYVPNDVPSDVRMEEIR